MPSSRLPTTDLWRRPQASSHRPADAVQSTFIRCRSAAQGECGPPLRRPQAEVRRGSRPGLPHPGRFWPVTSTGIRLTVVRAPISPIPGTQSRSAARAQANSSPIQATASGRLRAGRRRSGPVQLLGLRVVCHPLEVDRDHRLGSHDPTVMAWWKERHVAWPTVELGPVVHANPQHSRHVILEVLDFAALGLGDGLHRRRPSPARLIHSPANRYTAELDEFDAPLREPPDFARLAETLHFRFGNRAPPRGRVAAG